MIPPISIGMPVHNGEKYVGDAITSLLQQTFGDFELLVSDNASTDRTPEICRELASRDKRVKYMRHQINRGLIANYNGVFLSSQGRYFKWASANDICATDMLKKCHDIMEARPDVVLCYSRTCLFTDTPATGVDYSGGFDLMQDRPSERLKGIVGKLKFNNAMNGLARRNVLARTSLLGTYLASDVNLLVEMCLVGKFYEIPEYLFFRRIHPQELTGSRRVEDLLRVYDPSLGRRSAYKFWRLNLEHFRSVWHAPIPLSEKLAIYPFLARKLAWDRRKLWTEAITFGRGED